MLREVTAVAPWLRLTLRAAGLPLVLGVVAVPCGAGPSYGAEAAPSGSRAPSSSLSASAAASAPASASAADSGSSGSASPSSSPSSSDSASASASVSADPSRAGSRAGEGRVRPGRPEGPAAEVEGDDTASGEEADPDESGVESALETLASTPSESPQQAAVVPSVPPLRPAGQAGSDTAGAPAEPVLQILPLGTGLVLIGLGLGLAFVALRVRRG
ncbi:hypothetical protein ACIPSA_23200 [Streptomyces sp. NPDC086549]|uniref:hypothetical protein n=1 Tax=Streptomyces sp. NPDC086549 TaxID=3365752 RepID=UPI00382332FF